ncbi:MAG: hypothetical protein ACK5SM_02030, partial [Sphingomonadales bacterium]
AFVFQNGDNYYLFDFISASAPLRVSDGARVAREPASHIGMWDNPKPHVFGEALVPPIEYHKPIRNMVSRAGFEPATY